MISSGMKRGLAAAAVSALAVAGIPALATSASAASGDTLSVLSQAPIRNGNSAGGAITLKSSSPDLAGSNLLVTNADYSGAVAFDPAATELTSPAFNVDVKSVTQLDGDSTVVGNQKFADGFYHYSVVTAVTLGTATKATFGLVEDDGAPGVDAADPKTNVEVTPAGAPAAVDIATTTNPTAAGVPTPFTVTVKDAAGNLTQLVSGEQINVSGADAISDAALNSADLATGSASITATWFTGGTKTITATGNGTGATPATMTKSASETVFDQATITTDEFKFDTGADTWVDGTTAFGTPTQVRVDQNSVTFSFASKDGADLDTAPDDAGKVVLLKLDAPSNSAIRFNGKDANAETSGFLVVPVLLDSAGKGTTTVALSGATDGATWTFADLAGSITTTTVTMARAAASSVAPDSGVYVTKVGSPTSVTVTVKDQFGNPIGAPAQVSISRGARNGSTETARQTVDATGKATFTLPDAGTTAGTETFSVNLYDDQFDASANNFAGGTINYTATGQGADYVVAGATSDATATNITPLYDGNATPGVDAAHITIAGATAGTPATVTVDNGALILTGGDTTLDKGAASKTITLTGGNGSFDVVGTKFGVTTVTITSAGVTKTVKLTVKAPASSAATVATARNVALAGPDKANAGDVAVFTATVTDAFGNPVPGVPVASIPGVVSGPGNIQSTDAVTDAAGQLKYNVILSDNANSAVTLRVAGVSNGGTTPQFGASAGSTTGTANDAPGLTASKAADVATITDIVNIAELQKAVDDAQAAVDVAQNNLENAQGDLSVAKTEQKVAKKDVNQAKKALKKAKKHHKGVNNAKKNLNDAKGAKQIADSRVKAAQNKVDNAKATLAAAQAKLAAAQKALEDAQSDS